MLFRSIDSRGNNVFVSESQALSAPPSRAQQFGSLMPLGHNPIQMHHPGSFQPTSVSPSGYNGGFPPMVQSPGGQYLPGYPVPAGVGPAQNAFYYPPAAPSQVPVGPPAALLGPTPASLGVHDANEFVWDPSKRGFFHPTTELYFDSNSGYFYHLSSGIYYYYEHSERRYIPCEAESPAMPTASVPSRPRNVRTSPIRSIRDKTPPPEDVKPPRDPRIAQNLDK